MFRKFFSRLLVAVCLCTGIAWAEPSSQIKVPVTEFTLPNGLHVIMHEDHTVPVVHTRIFYRVGSANEQPGRTGLAHLFEHLMFEGSGHVQEGQYDRLLEMAGGSNNASTSEDTTVYYSSVPSTALDLPLFLESDRMQYLPDSMTAEVVDGQRDVVKNEMRQSYLNARYGTASLALPSLLYPAGHPYSWPVIGSMDDLSAASYEDVVAFFKKYYSPANACMVMSGDFDTQKAKKQVEYWFSDVQPGVKVPPVQAETPVLAETVRKTLYEKDVQPIRILVWHTPPAYTKDDITLDFVSNLLDGDTDLSLNKHLVFDTKMAVYVGSGESSNRLSSTFSISFQPSPGHTLDEVQAAIDKHLLRFATEKPSQESLEAIVNGSVTSMYSSLESAGSKAGALYSFYQYFGNPDSFAKVLSIYREITPEDVSNVVNKYLIKANRVELTVLPKSEEAQK